ncbi:MAG: ROK family glucokinase [Deltaproteobacteria bacterium]|nr:ROK family glucokinase [Deltaproteobacteria bacterium]
MRKSLIGVDLGGTNIRVAGISFRGEIFQRRKASTEGECGKDAVIEKLVRRIRHALEREKREGRKAVAIGVGVPGVILARRGIIVSSPNLPDWLNVPLKEMIRKEFALPVVVENDANAAAFGEKWVGVGKGANSLICLTLGTGVGGGIILDGKVWHGEDGMAAEVGHTTVNPDGPQCKCGNTGCLEVYASATGIVSEVRRRMKREGSLLKKSFQGREDFFRAEDVFRAAKKGDRVSLKVIEQMGRYLGIGIANLVNLFNPDMVVLSGGVTAAWKDFIEIVNEEVRARAFVVPRKRAKILKAKLGDNAGLIGAAGVALEMIREKR